MAANRLLILGGPPRSGTTMFSALLDGHSQFNWLLDEGFLFEHLFQLGSEGRDIFVSAAATIGLEALIEGLQDRSIMPIVHRPPSDLPSLRYPWDEQAFRTALAAVSQVKTPQALFEALSAAYRAGLGYGDRPWLVMKAADYGRSVQGALETMPDARGVIIVREPVAALNSLKAYRRKHGYKLLTWPTLSAALTDMNRLAAFATHEQASGRLLVLRYEDLVDDLNAQMDTFSRWLGVDCEPALLTPTMLGHPFGSNSSFVEKVGLEHAPKERPSVLSEQEQALVQTATVPFQQVFGYSA